MYGGGEAWEELRFLEILRHCCGWQTDNGSLGGDLKPPLPSSFDCLSLVVDTRRRLVRFMIPTSDTNTYTIL